MEKYVPDIYQKSIYTINYSNLKARGIKCLLFDLDNTLIPSGTTLINEKLKDFIDRLKKDFQIIIFSNAFEKRVKKVADEFETSYYALAFKPRVKSFKRVLIEHKLKECELAIIGDQLYTDIAGGNQAGITTILVNPISNRDSLFTRINRWLERKKTRKLYRKGLFTKGKYYE